MVAAAGQDEALAALGECRSYVGCDLAVAFRVFGEQAAQLGDRSRCAQVEVVRAAIGGGVDVQHATRSVVRGDEVGFVGERVADGVPDGAELPVGDLLQSVLAFGCRREAQPPGGADLGYDVLVGSGGEVVAFVDDHLAVALGELPDVLGAVSGQGLQEHDVDLSAGLGSSAAQLAGLDAEEVADLFAPL
ncbi:hypothetical protein SDC9_164870 [bioreactor metagenome]|uniref:Uncharacterized protein n=1 Tax=bioreactor metagenome TaxID=1076179 RepID=A0A645FUQ0_9ZZZZ